MNTQYTIPLHTIEEEMKMKRIYVPENYQERLLVNSAVNRPGLQLVGFFSRFDNTRLQMIGMVETMYLKPLPSAERKKCFAELFKRDIPGVVVCNGMEIFPECLESAEKYKIPLLWTDRDTSQFTAEMIYRLNNYLAPRITRHGVLVEVYGEGVLLLGESGVGKSETAIELVKRGHMLVADDAVEIKRVSKTALIGTAPELIRHYIELRGIGIIDVRRLFGMGAVTTSKQINLIINLEIWRDDAVYDRLGAETQYTEILGVEVPSLSMPVAPGRNLAVIVEVAAMNNKQKKMGFNAAEALVNLVDNGTTPPSWTT
ncbi:MAG: HPr(Ser) kinase/phosphatase [Oscillospiraceae bacterium]|jgi:HPr kinase/phosphorylase|nr:HPr(Ser) kinase/phosphatase [Oscillospiraceae bacterium]